MLLFAAVAGGMATARKPREASIPIDNRFSVPARVTIEGYSGHAMEPFLTRDGKYLVFNNRNDPKDQTDLHIAQRVSDLRFRYIGLVEGANSGALDGAPSVSSDGRFYFISTRDYERTGNTLWSGMPKGARVEGVLPLVTNFTPKRLLRLNIDMEISADGHTLYVAENRWDLFRGAPATSDLAMAARTGGRFSRLPHSDALMAAINTKALEFAPATSADQLTLYFTRLDMARLRRGATDAFMMMESMRPTTSAKWGDPRRIAAISGHVEGPTVTPDGCGLYFHRKDEELFSIYFTKRPCGLAQKSDGKALN